MTKTTNIPSIASPSLQPEDVQRNEGFRPAKDGAAKFPGGEIDQSQATARTPEEAVAEFVKHRSASAYEGVLSTVAASKGFDAFKSDPAKLQELFNNMVRVKGLSKTEASEGLDGQKKSNSNLTKLRKIAESSTVLTDPRVLSLLPSGGYTVMYECYRLHKVLAELDPATAVVELVKILEGHDGPLTRSWIEKQREKLKLPKSENADSALVPTDNSANAVAITGVDKDSVSESSARDGNASKMEVITRASNGSSGKTQKADVDHEGDTVGTDDAGEEEMEEVSITAVVMIVTEEKPSKSDLVEIGKVADNLDDDGVIIVYGPLAVLLSTADDIEPFGMRRCHKVYLCEPSGYDVSECRAVIVYTRSVGSTPPGDIRDWDPDPASLADQILSSVGGRKVLLFGSTEADGWEEIARQRAS